MRIFNQDWGLHEVECADQCGDIMTFERMNKHCLDMVVNIDKNPLNNEISNFMLFDSNSSHRKFHGGTGGPGIKFSGLVCSKVLQLQDGD